MSLADDRKVPPRPAARDRRAAARGTRGGTWHAYLLLCGDGSLYAGVTTDLAARLDAHRSGRAGRGARYTQGRGPLELVWSQEARDRSEAHRIEWALKRLRRARKLELVREGGRIALPER